MIETIKFLNPLRLPLKGERLIEASAGTGKTFTISVLYLRLLLGLGGSTAFPYPLNVEDILVVTFTDAATSELRSRIRSHIHALRIACLRQNTNHPLFKDLLDEITNKKKAAQWLLLAEQQMDKAAIFTIHGFCQRVLNLNAFEFGILYEQKLIEDESDLRYQVCADFWRRYYYPLPRDIAESIYVQWKNPKELLCDINRYLHGQAPLIKSRISKEDSLVSQYKKIFSRIIKLKKNWCEFSPEIEAIIENSGIDRHKFNRGNQVKWLQKIDGWAKEETHSTHLPSVLEKFSQRFLANKTDPQGVVPRHLLFSAIDDLILESSVFRDLLLIQAITKIRENIAYEKHRLGELGFDDILSRLDDSLSNEKGEALAAAIRARFPVAIIDEFQDTDPQQYRIFRRIWYQQSETALLLIGDPKQAIYAFRGADVFVYVKARNEVKSHYTLDTNWRSAPGMVTSVNTLFSRIDTAFIFREIPFIPVKSAKKNVTLHFEWQGKKQPAMSFYLMNEEGCSNKDYQIFMAYQSAAQIRDWLSAGVKGDALLWRDTISKPVRASDIAVLVRNHQEAALMCDALRLLGIPSIHLSNHDSVFNTLEAREILYLLQAVLSHGHKDALRTALASSMFGLTTLDIDFINNNSSSWDSIIAEFADYREIWKKHGVMTMLRDLMTRRNIIENMLAVSGGERRLTDIIHIGELLQEASSQLRSKPALIRWLQQNIVKPNKKSANQKIRLEDDNHLVQIVTIHKSKGLEYPLVWLPFIASYRIQHQPFYHDSVSFEPVLDLSKSQESMQLAEVERLAEDLRILYVALTRSVWHCSIGIAPLCRRRRGKKGKTDLHHSAIGYLLQQGKAKNASELRMALERLCDEHITLCIPDVTDNTYLKLLEHSFLQG